MDNTELFRFKQFNVRHSGSTMKVGTDAVILGSFVHVSYDSDILDVGTGCGVIALMISQKNPGAKVIGIDIDRESAIEAEYNFARSPWSASLMALHQSLQSFAQETEETFDHIISNPPFFSGDKHSIFPSRTKARHTVYLDHWDFLNACEKLLKRNGKLSVILPVPIAMEFIQKAAIIHLELNRLLKVRPKPNTPHNRYVMEFSRSKTVYREDDLLMYDLDSEYTSAYRSLTEDFYIHF